MIQFSIIRPTDSWLKKSIFLKPFVEIFKTAVGTRDALQFSLFAYFKIDKIFKVFPCHFNEIFCNQSSDTVVETN